MTILVFLLSLCGAMALGIPIAATKARSGTTDARLSSAAAAVAAR